MSDPEGDRIDLTPRERTWAILGALKAGLMIGIVYIVGLGLLVLFLIFVWNTLSGR